MSLKNLKVQKDIESPKDVLGGGGSTLKSNVYEGTIKLAFLKESQKGATGVELHVETENGYIHRETLWVTNRQGDNFYVKDGKKYYLPSFITMDDLAAVTNEVHLADLDTETKVTKLYDFEAKKEVPKEVEMIVDLIGKKALFAILEEQDFKNKLGNDGKYHPTEETYVSNTIDKVFNEDGFTVLELLEEQEEPEFIDKWLSKNKDKLRDRTKGKTPVTSSTSSKSSKPTKSLFNKS